MRRVLIRDQTAQTVQSNLDLQCPQKLLVLSSVREELRVDCKMIQATTLNLRNNFYLIQIQHSKLIWVCPVLTTTVSTEDFKGIIGPSIHVQFDCMQKILTIQECVPAKFFCLFT